LLLIQALMSDSGGGWVIKTFFLLIPLKAEQVFITNPVPERAIYRQQDSHVQVAGLDVRKNDKAGLWQKAGLMHAKAHIGLTMGNGHHFPDRSVMSKKIWFSENCELVSSYLAIWAAICATESSFLSPHVNSGPNLASHALEHLCFIFSSSKQNLSSWKLGTLLPYTRSFQRDKSVCGENDDTRAQIWHLSFRFSSNMKKSVMAALFSSMLVIKWE
jgi:hypothetical protein